MEGVVVKANAVISLAAVKSQSLNSTFNFPSLTNIFPVTNACALINLQSSNRGFKCAISGFCTKASFFNGLNNPVFLKFFSINAEILLPNSLTFTEKQKMYAKKFVEDHSFSLTTIRKHDKNNIGQDSMCWIKIESNNI